jgi:hypothetical protein
MLRQYVKLSHDPFLPLTLKFSIHRRDSDWQEFSLPHVVETGSGVHPTSYPKGTVGSFSGNKVARVKLTTDL